MEDATQLIMVSDVKQAHEPPEYASAHIPDRIANSADPLEASGPLSLLLVIVEHVRDPLHLLFVELLLELIQLNVFIRTDCLLEVQQIKLGGKRLMVHLLKFFRFIQGRWCLMGHKLLLLELRKLALLLQRGG